MLDDEENKLKRPIPITILCVIFFVLFCINTISVFMSFFVFSIGRSLWILFANIASFASVIGLWKMLRWGVYLYLGMFVVGVITFYLVPPPGAEQLNKPILMILIPLIYSVIVFPYWKRLK